MKPVREPYWASHKKHVRNGRLAWYAESADEEFWGAHWAGQVQARYYQRAEALNLETDELGRVLLPHLSRVGRNLEAGCGAGYWVAALQKHGFPMEGIEYSRELVTLVNDRVPHVPVRWADALALDVSDATYSSYVSFGVVEHREAGPEPFLTEARRVLKPDGVLLLSVPNYGPVRRLKAKLGLYEASQPAVPFFQYGFTATEFSRILSDTGFEVVRTHMLFANRLLTEELKSYRFVTNQRGGGLIRRSAERALADRDGHMVLFVAVKKP